MWSMAVGFSQWLILKFNIFASLFWYVKHTVLLKCLGCMKRMHFVKSSEFIGQRWLRTPRALESVSESWLSARVVVQPGNQVSCAAQPKHGRHVMAVIRTMYFILSLDVLTVTTCNYKEPTFWFLFCFHSCLCSLKYWNGKGKENEAAWFWM